MSTFLAGPISSSSFFRKRPHFFCCILNWTFTWYSLPSIFPNQTKPGKHHLQSTPKPRWFITLVRENKTPSPGHIPSTPLSNHSLQILYTNTKTFPSFLPSSLLWHFLVSFFPLNFSLFLLLFGSLYLYFNSSPHFPHNKQIQIQVAWAWAYPV